MTNAIVVSPSVSETGIAANAYAARNLFNDYQIRKSKNTLRSHFADLATFAEYLCEAGVTECPTADELQNMPEAWHGVTWGLVQGFVNWMLNQGLAIATINHKLKTAKVYAGLAAKAGIIDANDYTLIRTLTGFTTKEVKRVDEKRTVVLAPRKNTVPCCDRRKWPISNSSHLQPKAFAMPCLCAYS